MTRCLSPLATAGRHSPRLVPPMNGARFTRDLQAIIHRLAACQEINLRLLLQRVLSDVSTGA
jgi:hypothetical protein